MSVNLKNIYIKFKQFAGATIGPQLARYNDTSSVSAIYDQKDPNKIGRYPFLTVNITNISENSPLLEYRDDDGNNITATNWDALVTYSVFSTDKVVANDPNNSAEQIAYNLKSRLTSRDALCQFSDVGEVVDVSSVSSTDFKRDNEVGLTASFNMIFTVYGEESDATYQMNEFIADLALQYEGSDEDVLSTTITVTK